MSTLEQLFTKRYIRGLASGAQILQETQLQDQNPIVLNQLAFLDRLGAGKNAIILRAKLGQKDYAVRVSTGRQRPENLAIQVLLAEHNAAPMLYAVFYIEYNQQRYELIVMDLIAGTLRDNIARWSMPALQRALYCLLDKKYLLKVLHGDLHTDNIVVLKDGHTLGLIDFEFANITTKLGTVLDFIPLLSTAGPKLSAMLLEYYRTTFNMEINTRDLRIRSEGGYEYRVSNTLALISYRNPTRQVTKQLFEAFPSLKLPRVKD